MTILQPDIITGLTLNYIKRYDTAINYITLTDEQENVVISVPTFNEIEQEWYSTIKFQLVDPLINYRYYMFRIYSELGDLLYADKCFCTDQPIDSFSVNTGTYENAPDTPNEYIIYEQ